MSKVCRIDGLEHDRKDKGEDQEAARRPVRPIYINTEYFPFHL
jgi:hypothetical protein